MAAPLDRFKLFTVEQVAAIFPGTSTGKRHVLAVEDLITTHGTYRKFGDLVLLTESDIENLLAAMAAKHQTSSTPPDDTEGYIVFIGSRTADPDTLIAMVWAPIGGVERVLHQYQSTAPDKVDLLDVAPCTFGTFKQHRKAMIKHRWGATYWQTRAPEFVAYMNNLVSSQPNFGDDES